VPTTKPGRRGLEERNALVEAHLRLTGTVLRHLPPECLHRLGGEDDARQIAYLGLLRAAGYWDETRGLKFSTYAVHCMRNALQDAMRDRTCGMVHVPRWAPGEARRMSRKSVPAHWWRECLLAPEADRGEEDRLERAALVRAALRQVPEPRRSILAEWAGGTTQQVIADRLGVSKSRVGQIVKEGLQSLKVAILNRRAGHGGLL
jgi:RNA polymerase sigma factor (sigma-70 family)